MNDTLGDFPLKKILTESVVTGAMSIVSAWTLTKLYKELKFTPPNEVFWFFIGFNAQFVVGLVKELAATKATGLGGLGESIDSIDSKIKKYQANIFGLKRILRVGSAKGKVAAGKKLAFANKNLATLYRMRNQAKVNV